MATTEQLAEQGILERLDGVLDHDELVERRIYLMPRAVQWLESTLGTIETDGYVENAASPLQQADDLFYDFISGAEMAESWPPHWMYPQHDGVWELRTPDLRFFGWFTCKGTFIVSAIDTKENCKLKNLYRGYRNQCVSDRNSMELDEPKYILGELDDVL